LTSASGQALSPNVERALGSISTIVQFALIFAIIIAILELWVVVLGLGLTGGFTGVFPMGVFPGVFPMLVFLIIDVLVIRHTSKIHSAANNGDIAALKSLNSLGYAIVALIFTGFIPGILLLIAYGWIYDLPSPQV